jgi:acetylornithine deacetylase/succinyl-diaminopimelate desuccinylase-like protein
MRSSGTPGHGSQPYGADNALVPLAEAIARLGEAPMPVDITPEWRTFVEGLPLDPFMAERLLDPDQVDAAIDDLAVDDVAFARWVHACTHMTFTPSIFNSGVKSNVVPDSGIAEVDVRKLPGQDEADVDDHFRKVLGPDLWERIEVEPVMTFPANSSPASGPLWEAIGDSLEAMTGSRAMVPAVIPVTTDARFLRARGTTVYGVGLYDDSVTFGEMLSMFHGNDERVSERSVALTTELLARTVARFGERTG